MKQLKLPTPPNPDDYQYRGSPLEYNRAVYEWAARICGRLEQSSLNNNTPIDQSFVTSTTAGFALTTFIASTSTGTDITNFIISVVNAMQKKGLLKAVNVGHD